MILIPGLLGAFAGAISVRFASRFGEVPDPAGRCFADAPAVVPPWRLGRRGESQAAVNFGNVPAAVCLEFGSRLLLASAPN